MNNESQNENLEGRTVEHSKVFMSQVMMPQHAGPGGIFVHGGEIIKLMDTAAGLVALRHSHEQVVTLRIEGINFYNPIRVGNFVTIEAKMTFTSNSSMEVQVSVKTENVLKEKVWDALKAYFIFVALDKNGHSKNIPPLIVKSEEEKKLFEAGHQRFNTCRIDEMTRILCSLD
jgi:acyl-CoA hydrolase